MIRQLWVVETKLNKSGEQWWPMTGDVYETRSGARVASSNYNYDDAYATPERVFLHRVRKYVPLLQGYDKL